MPLVDHVQLLVDVVRQLVQRLERARYQLVERRALVGGPKEVGAGRRVDAEREPLGRGTLFGLVHPLELAAPLLEREVVLQVLYA